MLSDLKKMFLKFNLQDQVEFISKTHNSCVVKLFVFVDKKYKTVEI